MKRLTLLAAIVAAVAAVPIAHAAPAVPDVPSTIAVPDGNKVFLVGHAVGVQIYQCNATVTGYAWGFLAPRADLYDDHGKPLARHFSGPTWQARDGSYVVGQVVDRATVDPSAIRWLLLTAASTASGSDGDRLAATTYIQRVATTGGLAPAAATCDAETSGTIAEVSYTADYYFWKATGADS